MYGLLVWYHTIGTYYAYQPTGRKHSNDIEEIEAGKERKEATAKGWKKTVVLIVP